MKPIVELIRLEESSQGTFGVLKINKEVFCVTLEPEDRLNVENVSSIPAQQYICDLHHSPNFGLTWKVTDVPGRTDVLFHSGNWARDTEACILLAQYWGKLQGHRAVLNSGKTFKQFMAIMDPFSHFHLTIREVY
jgi:hypothetical protein